MTTTNEPAADVVPVKESATRPILCTDIDENRDVTSEDILPIAQALIGGLTTEVIELTEKIAKQTRRIVALERQLRDARREINELKPIGTIGTYIYIKNNERIE
eukprot:342144_1